MWRLLLDSRTEREIPIFFYAQPCNSRAGRPCCAPSGGVGLLLVLLQVQNRCEMGILATCFEVQANISCPWPSNLHKFFKRKMFKERFSSAPVEGHSIQTHYLHSVFCLQRQSCGNLICVQDKESLAQCMAWGPSALHSVFATWFPVNCMFAIPKAYTYAFQGKETAGGVCFGFSPCQHTLALHEQACMLLYSAASERIVCELSMAWNYGCTIV